MTAGIESAGRARVLDPIDRNSEILFGLFMVLTFTGTLSVATAGRDDVRMMLLAAIGCNIAWGFVDAMMYVLRSLVARARRAALLRNVRAAAQPEDAHRLIADDVAPLAGGLDTPGLEFIRQWLLGQPSPEAGPVRPTARELRGAVGVFLLVVASTFPPVLPFVFMTDLRVAMRVSAAIAIVMLFLCGYNWGRYAGVRPVRVGVVLVLLGVMIQAVVIALGG
jgi:VIT1/CCC1 family predicted Fe2+/Mn2+ transporter